MEGMEESAPPRWLFDGVRDAIRVWHYSIRTEEAYVGWIRRFILFHQKRYPASMGAEQVNAFLTYLATGEDVARTPGGSGDGSMSSRRQEGAAIRGRALCAAIISKTPGSRRRCGPRSVAPGSRSRSAVAPSGIPLQRISSKTAMTSGRFRSSWATLT